MEPSGGSRGSTCRVSRGLLSCLLSCRGCGRRDGRTEEGTRTRRILTFPRPGSNGLVSELQGHAIKNADLLIASGAVTLPSSSTEAQEALEEDLQAVSPALLLLLSPPFCFFTFTFTDSSLHKFYRTSLIAVPISTPIPTLDLQPSRLPNQPTLPRALLHRSIDNGACRSLP